MTDTLARISDVRVAVFGDFCLDAYWIVDADLSERSVETDKPVWRTRQQAYSLGGAGNVTANLADLGVAEVHAVGLIGDDLFGWQMLQLMQRKGVRTDAMLQSQSDWQTMVYAKPHVADEEQSRIDFGAFNTVSIASIDALIEQLGRAADHCQVVILNQQVPAGVSPPEMIERINGVVAAHPQCRFIVDSRHRAELYEQVMLKLNAHEAARLCGQPVPLDERIEAATTRRQVQQLQHQAGRAVFVTRGENGLLAADGGQLHEVPGIQVLENVDPVGAGDTAVAALAAALGAGCDVHTAAKLANVAASVTVRKLRITGTATPDELRRIGPEPDYIYLPELADDPRKARYLSGAEIEIVRDLSKRTNIRHAIFDHDGTISTLREGWEKIMEPMMVRAILGARYDDADEALYHKVVGQVRRFIDKTTGIQTLVQMQGLVKLVEEFGCVPADEVRDEHGYKGIYNDELLAMVRRRIAKLEAGELAAEDFMMKNVRALLEQLVERGVTLYLASGTDQADVAAEAEALGYAHLFGDRIHGAVGDVSYEAKRVVLERILSTHQLSGEQLVTFGDGPVEIRETRKRRGWTVGVASDEVRRFGLNPAKRTRLVRAGADLIVPDFSQLDQLLGLLGMSTSK